MTILNIHCLYMRSGRPMNEGLNLVFGGSRFVLRGFSSRITYPKSFREWLAGVIDGDGCLLVRKKKYPALEITMGLEDLPLLQYILHMLGGSVIRVSGAKAYRYQLQNRRGMIHLIHCINGEIQNSVRRPQLHRVCQVLDIPVIPPVALDAQSNWFAGFFDADGYIGITMNNQRPQLRIQITNKLLEDLEAYKSVFGGNIHFDSWKNGSHTWSVQSRKDVIMMLEYFQSSTFRSRKSKRFFLIESYFRLRDLQACKPASIDNKSWLAFQDKWNNFLI